MLFYVEVWPGTRWYWMPVIASSAKAALHLAGRFGVVGRIKEVKDITDAALGTGAK